MAVGSHRKVVGQIQLREHVERGIERFPAALLTLFEGGHIGKLLVSV